MSRRFVYLTLWICFITGNLTSLLIYNSVRALLTSPSLGNIWLLLTLSFMAYATWTLTYDLAYISKEH